MEKLETVQFEKSKKCSIKSPIIKEFIAEYFATLIMMLIGNASVAWTVLNGSDQPETFAVCFAWGLAVMMGCITAGGVSGAHMNPAVTVALMTLRKFSWRKVPAYILAQCLGSFSACALLYFNYFDALNHHDPEHRRIHEDRREGTALIFATYPESYVTITTCLVDQTLSTGILMFMILAVKDPKNTNLHPCMHPLTIGLVVTSLVLGFGSNCMAGLNPARDIPPRIFTAIAGWGLDTFSDLNYNYWWVNAVGAHLGAILGGWFYYLGIERNQPDKCQSENNLSTMFVSECQ